MGIESKLSDDNSVLTISVKGVFNFTLLNEFRQAYTDNDIASADVIVDLGNATSLDSSALGMLLSMQEYLGKPDGKIKIVNCNESVMKVFNITRFDKKFNIE